MKKVISYIGSFILGILSISIWYGCETATTNHNCTPVNQQVCSIFGDRRVITDTIYLHNNGRHVDIIVPEGNTGKYTGYGWGSKTFYLDVPTWDDLTFRAVFNAVDKENETLMHVKENLIMMEDWVAIPVTKYQWNDLHQHINASFALDSSGGWDFVADGYGDYDMFYRANGEYGLYYTCNSWANEMLRESGIYARKHAIFSEEVIDIHRK
jgi:hypothetical protein